MCVCMFACIYKVYTCMYEGLYLYVYMFICLYVCILHRNVPVTVMFRVHIVAVALLAFSYSYLGVKTVTAFVNHKVWLRLFSVF